MTIREFTTSCFLQAIYDHMSGREEEAQKLLKEALWSARLRNQLTFYDRNPRLVINE